MPVIDCPKKEEIESDDDDRLMEEAWRELHGEYDGS
jgi:hypothetical protein